MSGNRDFPNMRHPKQTLAAHGLEPKQSLGQTFLYDDNILARMVQAAEVTTADNVLEIGPGTGNLTAHLAQAAGRVVAVELDERLIPLLRSELAQHDNITIVHGDILEHEPGHWFGDAPYKVVANVPYYITGAILQHLLSGGRKPELAVLTVQKEVAQRITARPGDMSLLSVSVQFYGQAEIVTTLKAGAFWPRPDVDSAILRIRLRTRPLLPLHQEADFFDLVRTGFSQKRKQLQKNLRALGYSRREIVDLLQQAGVEPRRRAQALSVQEWLQVYKTLNR